MTTSMTSKNHIFKMVSKVQCMSGLVKRSSGFNAPVSIKLQLYFSHVRSLLDYCTPLWSLYQINEIMRINRVQSNVTKFILNEYLSDVSYRNRYLALGILQLCYRKEIRNLCFLYKFRHDEIDIKVILSQKCLDSILHLRL